MQQTEEKEKRFRRLAEPVYEWISAMVIALIPLVLLFSFVVRMVGVNGDSMVPTLTDGDRLILSCIGNDYRYGDIVVVDRYTKEPLIKRVIAVAGDEIRITPTYQVYVNGQLLSEPYIQGITVKRDFDDTMVVPDGYLFVMGDNRSVSLDSRSKEVGIVSVKNVVGKVLFRIWPLTEGANVGLSKER